LSIASAVVAAVNEKTYEVERYLKTFSEIEITARRDDEFLILIDADDERIKEISQTLSRHDEILSVLHHSIYFE
jgi:nitrate reductase NapAB chaperone NapD